MNRIKISAVSYTNTKPFVYGLEHSDIIHKINLSLDNPSDCAGKLIENKVDIGLIPVAALNSVPDAEVISDYCIGANGSVNSVFIFSNKPVQEIQTLRLDLQSRTSNALAQILLNHYWKAEVHLTTTDADAFVEIGDRTFGKKDRYPFAYDLALEWKNFTGLPFVFAVWASNKPIPQDFIKEFNSSLQLGLDNIDQVISGLPSQDNFSLTEYLTKNLDYRLTADKLDGLRLFLTYLNHHVNLPDRVLH